MMVKCSQITTLRYDTKLHPMVRLPFRSSGEYWSPLRCLYPRSTPTRTGNDSGLIRTYLKLLVLGELDTVTVTDLFSLANQCPRHTLTNQRAEHIDSFFLSKTIFSIPFWKSASRTESTRSAKKKGLSPVACYRNQVLTILTVATDTH